MEKRSQRKRKATNFVEKNSDSSIPQRWVRQRLLGAGGFGSVFLAHPSKPTSNLPSIMAVKSSRLSESTELLHESQLLTKFNNCPQIINTYGTDVTEDLEGEPKLFNVLLEFAQRGTLEEWIQKFKDVGLHESHVRRFTLSILKGLDYMHGKGYVHCDIKPANVLLVRQGSQDTGFDSYTAKIGDLGVSKKADMYDHMKRSEYTCGTELYMSPETFLDKIQEPPADIWALGVTVLQSLTGTETMEVTDYRGDCRKVRAEVPVIPKRLSEEAKDFLGKCFIVNPLKRYTAAMLLKHPFVRKTLTIRTDSRNRLGHRNRMCLEESAFPMLGGRRGVMQL